MIFERMYRFALWLKDSAWGGVIYSALDALGVRILIGRSRNYILNYKKHRYPTKEMHESRQFYRNNKEKVNQVMKILGDEQSRDCYRRMIRFRCTYNHKILPANSYRSQYFGNPYFTYTDQEVFVDCGAFDGDTIKKFKKKMAKERKTYKRVIAVEADRRNGENLARNHPDVMLVRGGAWDRHEYLGFRAGNGENCRIQSGHPDGQPVEVIQAYALDEIAECRESTFIKMDIEGAEQRALKGMQKTIQKNHPKMAISIYHSDADMVEIPLMIQEMNPSYHFYVMQHTNTACDTVLYVTE